MCNVYIILLVHCVAVGEWGRHGRVETGREVEVGVEGRGTGMASPSPSLRAARASYIHHHLCACARIFHNVTSLSRWYLTHHSLSSGSILGSSCAYRGWIISYLLSLSSWRGPHAVRCAGAAYIIIIIIMIMDGLWIMDYWIINGLGLG